MNFLFWNINKKDLSESIVLLAKKYNVDVLILAEAEIDNNKLLLKLNQSSVKYYPPHPLSKTKKIKIFTRFHYDYITPIKESDRFTIRKINFPAKEAFLFTAVHFLDKGNHNNDSQTAGSSIMVKQIEKIETRLNISKNIVIGDFNMNPFEIGMINADGFHATMSEDIALNNSRIVQGVTYKYFYNPMWSLYGDLLTKPAGTYFYSGSEYISYQWNIFDQLLLRPEVIPIFDKSSLEILTTDGNNNFMRLSNRPNSTLFSDHLPIKFSINF